MFRGTLNLLEAAVAAHFERFVFTSTTSLMVSALVRAGLDGGAKRAAWITEDMAMLEPRNIYGVTKLARSICAGSRFRIGGCRSSSCAPAFLS